MSNLKCFSQKFYYISILPYNPALAAESHDETCLQINKEVSPT